MASLKEVNKIIARESVPSKSGSSNPLREAVPGFIRGVFRSPADADAMARAMRGRGGDRFPPVPGLPSFDQMLASKSADFGGMESAPETFVGRTAERLGRTAPFASAGAAGGVLGSVAPVIAARNAVIGDVIASMAEQGTEDAGGGPGWQMAAGIAAGIVSPSSVGDDVSRGSTKAASTGARRVADEVADAATERAEAEAKRLNVKMKHMRRAAGEAKRRMASDPYGGEQFVSEGIEKIRRARELFPDPKSRPTTAQILSNEPAVVGMDAALGKIDDEFRQSSAGRRRVVQNDLMSEWERILPDGSPGGVNSRARSAYDAAKIAEREAWDAIPFDKMPHVDTTRIKAELNNLRRSRAGRRYLPQEAADIDAWSFDEPVSEIQGVLSELLDTQRAGSRLSATSDDIRRAKRVKPLIDALKREIDRIPPSEGGQAYRAAREATRQLYETFNFDSSGVDAILNLGTSQKIARAIASSDQPVAEARRAVRILDQTPGGRDNLARVFIDDLFGESLDEKTPRAALAKLRRSRQVYREVLGDERMRLFESLIERAEMARRNKTGTSAAISSTGSGIGPVDILFGAAEAVTEPVQSTWKLAKYIGKFAKTDRQKNAILREALYDPELWQTLLEMPEPRAVAKWIVDFDVIVARSRAREAARSGIRSGISGQENERSVNAPLPSGSRGVR